MSTATDLAARLPWVTRLDETRDCDGYRWSHLPLAALSSSLAIEKYRCRNRARWQFTALREEDRYAFAAWDGTYCWAHLWTQLQASPAEEDRLRQWLGQQTAALRDKALLDRADLAESLSQMKAGQVHRVLTSGEARNGCAGNRKLA